MILQGHDSHFDFLIVGSGFGGSVCAMRLAQKGYSVAVLEAGRRFKPEDFAQSNWQISKYLWLPWVKCFGIQRISLLKGLFLLHGAGVGGGSLVYANTLMRAQEDILRSPEWPQSVNWPYELREPYDLAEKMLGVCMNPGHFAGENVLKELAEDMKCLETYHPTRVGVYFGKPGESVDDPYFSGQGPKRSGCTFCGACMVGCRVGAKNTLDQNYLYLAENYGAKIFADCKVEKIIPTVKGYTITTRKPSTFLGRSKGFVFSANQVILSAGVLGTTQLLLNNKFKHKTLPNISDQLGSKVRTNGESLLGATALKAKEDYSHGIAIGSAFHPNPDTKIENVRYPSGSSFMRLLAVPLTGPGGVLLRPIKMAANFILQFTLWMRLFLVRDWAKSSVILLVMQSVDQKLKLTLGRGLRAYIHDGLSCAPEAHTIPSYLPLAQEAAALMAKRLDGVAQNIIPEVLLGTPASAHILGGCTLAESADLGVVNPHHEVFGYKGLFVCDGSVIGANLAVNPSLTIAALAERFCKQFPPKPLTPTVDSFTALKNES